MILKKIWMVILFAVIFFMIALPVDGKIIKRTVEIAPGEHIEENIGDLISPDKIHIIYESSINIEINVGSSIDDPLAYTTSGIRGDFECTNSGGGGNDYIYIYNPSSIETAIVDFEYEIIKEKSDNLSFLGFGCLILIIVGMAIFTLLKNDLRNNKII